MKPLQKLLRFAALLGLLTPLASSAATGSFTGSYATNFDGLGTGTAMPVGYRSMVIAGGNTTYAAGTSISTAGIASATVSGTQTLTAWSTGTAVASSATALFNCSWWGSSTDRSLGTDPTGTAANVIELSLTNSTGSNLLGLVFSYSLKVLTNGSAGTEASELPGYAFFYSTSGGTTAAEWTRVDALSLNNSTQGTIQNSGNVIINFGTALTNKGIMYFRWADDNNQASSPDQMIAIDNVSITPSANIPPTVSITSPTNNAAVEAGTNLTISATAADSNGSVAKIEFFSGATKLGEVISAPFNFIYTNVPLGAVSLTARATDNDGATTTSTAINVTGVPDLGTGAVYFDGVNDYITFGAATATIGVSNFTVECWFKRTGAGVTTSTGTGGVTAYPLVTKGRGEADGSNVDCNFFLGFDANNHLTADFEDYNTGLNHPVTGIGTITSNVWQHAAVTYDVASGTWVLYLNGVPDATNVISGTDLVRLPRYDSIQHAGIATAMTSTGAAAGFFNGKIDEVRVWNYARSAADIQANYQQQISGLPGLIGRWSLDETNGTTVGNTGTSGVNGTLLNGPLFVSGFPFGNPPVVNSQPDVPALVSPALNETGVTNYPNLKTFVSDPDTNVLTVTFYGRAAVTSNVPDFTIIALPDTQFYSQLYPQVFQNQTDWIVSNRTSMNIVYVAQLGDCVQDGDNGGNDVEWRNATNALYRLENPATTLLTQGIPYGVAVGNHDQGATGNGIATDTTTFFNTYFGTNHFLPYNYYGGNFGTNNDNHYDLFSANGMDFVAVYFEYDTTATATNAPLYDWANNILQTYSNRLGIVVSHWIMNSGTGGTFGAQGQTIYNALRGNTNLFLMLCGHVNPNGEGRRSDTFNGKTVWTLLSDYQDLANGGNGWLRIYTFSPANNVIHAQTYSPWLNQYQTGAGSQFDIPFQVTPTNPFTVIGTVSGVASSNVASLTWPGLAKNTAYEWYVTVSDGQLTRTGPLWSFVTGTNAAPVAPTVTLTSPTNGTSYLLEANVSLSASVTDVDGTVTNVAFYQGTTKLADISSAPFTFSWTAASAGSFSFRAVVTDDSGLSATSAVSTVSVVAPKITRGPYLQLSTPTSIVIRWRTDVASSSQVTCGTSLGNLSITATDNTVTTEHIVTVTNLQSDMKYFYTVGANGGTLAGPDANLFFLTHPQPGSAKPLHLWVIGDAGTGTASQKSVRDAFYTANGTNLVHGWLQLGDNAYNSGLDSEYQANMFDIYTNLLRNAVTWPTLGNHETAQSTAYVDTYAHFQVFTLPTAGEAGGVASGTEHYYSFDLGQAHFICLDSMTADRSTTGAMATWLKADLAANTNRWLIAFWHHPPYTKGSHNSDTETELIQMRQNFNPILEAGGVDLVLSGHSHCYERSYLIDGHYGLSTTFTTNMIVQSGSGRETNGVGAYVKPLNSNIPPTGNRGAIYSVVGSSGQTSGGSLNHPAMFLSLNNLGSMVLDITSNRLNATFLRETGATNDSFTIVKAVLAPALGVQRPIGNDLTNQASVNFGVVNLGSFVETTCYVTNRGNAALTSLSISIDGTNASDFLVVTNPATSVVAGGATSFTVRFTPGAKSQRSAALHITSNDPNSPFNLILTGNGNSVPQAQDATFTRAAGLSLKISIADLLTNNTSDADADLLTLKSIGASAQGATLSTNASLIFYSPANNNSDSFSYSITDGHGGNATANVNVLVVNPGGLARAAAAQNGIVSVNFAGIPGFEYDVQHSTNLVDWVFRGTFLAPANGLFLYQETNPPSPSFFRLIQH